MGLRIGFDLDGVLADMEGALLAEATTLFGGATGDDQPPLDSEDGSIADKPSVTGLGLSVRRQSRLWRHVQTIENFWEGSQGAGSPSTSLFWTPTLQERTRPNFSNTSFGG